MKNKIFSHTGIAALCLVTLMMIGILPGLVAAQPGGAPPIGSVDAKFDSLQVIGDGTFGGNIAGSTIYAQNGIQNNKAGVNPLVLNDLDGVVVQGGPFFDVEQPIMNNMAGQLLELSDTDGIKLNKIAIAADSSINNTDANVPVTFNDADGVKVTSGSLDVTSDIKNSTAGQPVKINDDEGLLSSIVDNSPTIQYAINGTSSGSGSDSGGGVLGQSDKGVGVSGGSQSGYGLFGSSNSSYGIYAKTASGPAALYVEGGTVGVSVINGQSIGVNAQGTTNGVIGNSTSGVGVKGSSSSSDGVTATSVSGYGVNASSSSGIAVRANSPNNNAIQASSTTGTAMVATTSSGNGLNASSVGGIGVSATSTNGTGVDAQGGINGGTFKNSLLSNAVNLATTSYGIDVTSGGANITGALKATSIGTYTTFSSSAINIPTGSSGTATISCPAPSSRVAISCDFSKGSSTLPLIINSTAINVASKSCSVAAYNNSGSTISLQASVLCFDPAS